MGSKNLRTIIVYGTQNAHVDRPGRLKEEVRELRRTISKTTKGLSEFGTGGSIPNDEKLDELGLAGEDSLQRRSILHSARRAV